MPSLTIPENRQRLKSRFFPPVKNTKNFFGIFAANLLNLSYVKICRDKQHFILSQKFLDRHFNGVF